MKHKDGKPGPQGTRVFPMTILFVLLCGFSFYLGGIFCSEKNKIEPVKVEDVTEAVQSSLQLKPVTFAECSSDYQDYTPCTDPRRWRKYGVHRLTFMERHCPPVLERKECLVPPPDGYKPPIRWPNSRDECWYRNVPYDWINKQKSNQNWLRKEGEKFLFPGGGTMFPRGVSAYVDLMQDLIPEMKDGTVRTAIDTGCGVASWGGDLLDRGILTVSLAPRDNHEAQVQFALERGIPAILGIISTQRLPFPSNSFDMAHCSRCLIPWTEFGGIYLLEVHRILRPGGFWVLSGPPVNYENRWRGWNTTIEEQKSDYEKLQDLLTSLCFKLYNKKDDIAVWQKLSDSSCYNKLSEPDTYPAKCDDSLEPDSGWYTPLRSCVVVPDPKLKKSALKSIPQWPGRLHVAPERISDVHGGSASAFKHDDSKWRVRLKHYKKLLPAIGTDKIRNVMDMNTVYGGFAAATIDYPLWVMNVVSSYAVNTLPVVYDRGLIGKKLPGPAALAQMKLEVESLGRDYGETRLRKSPVKLSSPQMSPHMSPATEFSLDNVQKFQKENEFLTERLLAMEEETKMLKEALAKRNSDVLDSRSMYAQAANKLQTLEAQLQINNLQKGSPKSVVQITPGGSSSQDASNPPSLTSLSEDSNDDTRSYAESWATTLEKNNAKSNKSESQNDLNLMDDFLEMEKLACLPNDSNGAISSKTSERESHDAMGDVTAAKDVQSEQQHDSSPLVGDQASSNAELSGSSPESDESQLPLVKLRSKICMLLEFLSKETDFGKVVEDIKLVVQEAQDTLHPHTVKCVSEEVHSSDALCDRQANPDDSGLTTEKEITLSQPATETKKVISEDLASAISLIHDFVLSLGKEVMEVHGTFPDGDGLTPKIEEFSGTFSKVIHGNLSLGEFVLGLSHVLANASELKFNVLGFKGVESETNSPDCIDKVALPENKVVEKDSSQRFQNVCVHIPNHTNPEVPDDGNLVSGYEPNAEPCKISLEEFEQLKSEKDNLATDLARCSETLEITKSQLQETEQLLAEAKSQFASAKNSNSLAETQLKCMAESYRSLESRAQELETELKLLQVRNETLESELQEEKRNHQDALARCTELQEQLKSNERLEAETEFKTKQDRELADAAEKLAECQETIFLLGKQLKALHPQTEVVGSPYSGRSQKGEGFAEDEPTTSAMNLQDSEKGETEGASSVNVNRVVGSESPINLHNSPCPSDTEAGTLLKSPVSSKSPKHKSSKSTPSSTSSTPTPEKHQRGISRFFSSKGKNGY